MKLFSTASLLLRTRRDAAFVLYFCLATFCSWGAQEAVTDLTSSPAVTERGAHHRRWEWTTSRTLPDGTIFPQKHSYTEFQTGMHYSKNGKWTESSEQIELLQDGAAAQAGQHQVVFAANLNYDQAVVMFTP